MGDPIFTNTVSIVSGKHLGGSYRKGDFTEMAENCDFRAYLPYFLQKWPMNCPTFPTESRCNGESEPQIAEFLVPIAALRLECQATTREVRDYVTRNSSDTMGKKWNHGDHPIG